MNSMLTEPYLLVSVAVRSFLLLLLTAGISLAFRRRSAAVLHGIWTVGLGASLATPILILLIPSWTLPVLPPEEVEKVVLATRASVQGIGEAERPATVTRASPDPEPSVASHQSTTDHQAATTKPVLQAEQAASPTPSAAVTGPARGPSPSSLAVYLWAVGVILILFRLVHQTLLDVAKRYRCPSVANSVAMARSSNVESRIAAILSTTRSPAMLGKRSFRVFLAMALSLGTIFGTCHLTSWADETQQEVGKAGKATREDSEAATMVVRVLSEEGEPLSGAKLQVSIWEMHGARNYPNRDYTTDQQGRVEVERPRQLRIMRLWPAKEGYVPEFVNFAKGTHEEGRLIPEEYEFRLQKGHRLSGRVVAENGSPISNAKVQVWVIVDEPPRGVYPDAMINTWLTVSDFNGPTPITDSDGRWSIDNAPGPPKQGRDFQFRLRVTHPNFAGDTRWGGLQQTVVAELPRQSRGRHRLCERCDSTQLRSVRQRTGRLAATA